MTEDRGPLTGVAVLELAGIGPGPHAAMVLADLGADVVRVVRPGAGAAEAEGVAAGYTLRGRTLVEADLKDPASRDAVLDLVALADVLVESMRPGAVDRLGLGAATCRRRNPGLVYAHMTGWGQDGPLAATAGHDINYLAMSGALFPIGTAETPLPPLNLLGDYGGGSMFLVTGVLAALVERSRTGRGRELDVAMVDGAAVLSQAVLQRRAAGRWQDRRAANLLDGGAPYYRTYACRGGGHVAVGALEPQFYAQLCERLGLDDPPPRDDPARWPELEEVLAARFAERTRDEWAAVFDGSDACVSPVLTYEEAAAHPHLAHRGTLGVPGAVVAAPAPRFGGSGPDDPDGPGPRGRASAVSEVSEVLGRWRR